MSEPAKQNNATLGWFALAVALYLAVANGKLELPKVPSLPFGPSVVDVDRFPVPSPALQSTWSPLIERMKADPQGAALAAGTYAAVANLIESRAEIAATSLDVKSLTQSADRWSKDRKVGTDATGKWIRETLKAQIGEEPVPLDEAKRRAVVENYRAIAWALREAT